MKLKALKNKARKLNQSWIAVDKDKSVYGYTTKPSTGRWDYEIWTTIQRYNEPDVFIGVYTGKKKWKNTRSKV